MPTHNKLVELDPEELAELLSPQGYSIDHGHLHIGVGLDIQDNDDLVEYAHALQEEADALLKEAQVAEQNGK